MQYLARALSARKAGVTDCLTACTPSAGPVSPSEVVLRVRKAISSSLLFSYELLRSMAHAERRGFSVHHSS